MREGNAVDRDRKTENSKAAVLIVDDYPLFRHGLRALLSEQDDISVAGEAESAAEVDQAVATLRPNVVLLDLDLPDGEGLEILAEIKRRHPAVRTIVMAGPEDDLSLAEAIEKGAAGYMLKTAGPPLILAAIRTVHEGGTWLQREVTGKLFEEFTRLAQIRRDAPENVLTERETEVLTLLAQGFKNRQIAERLFITERTVKVHVSNVFRKLGLSDRVQATRYAIRQRLVTL